MKVKDIEFFFKNGLWCAIISKRKFVLEKPCDYRAVVKILECKFSEVNDVLGRDFNYKNVVLSALAFDSEYWDSLALRWLENEDVDLDEDICAILKNNMRNIKK